MFLSSHRALALIRTNNQDATVALREGARLYPEHLPFRRASALPPATGSKGPASDKALKKAGLEALAYLFAEFRQWGQCLDALREMQGISPLEDVDLLLLQSNALESSGRRDEALAVLRQCHRLQPKHPTVQNNLGYHLLDSEKDIPETAALISAALAQEPDNASYRDSWGWALFRQGKFQEAESALRKAVEANPLSPEIRKHLGETLLRLDRPHDALEQFERALAFASPDRKNLEDRVGKLKTELAKKAREEAGADEYTDDPDSDSDDDDDDDGWRP